MTVEIYSLIGTNERTSGKFMTSPTTGERLPFIAAIGDEGGALDIQLPGVPVPLTISCGKDPGPDITLQCLASMNGRLRRNFQLRPYDCDTSLRARVTQFVNPDPATFLFAAANVPVGTEKTFEILLYRIPTK